MKIAYVVVLFSLLFAFGSCGRESSEKPDDSRFTPVVLAEDLDEPMAFEVMSNGNVLIAERKGGLKLYDAANDTVVLVKHIPVATKYTSKDGRVSESEEGFMGLSLDPDFDNNHWVYLYYSHPAQSKHVLTRWELTGSTLNPSSMKTVLEVGIQREVCCHTGGGMTWDGRGNLYLTVGNNTGNSLMAHTDERRGRENWDDQGHAANTNDLRGKILRIHPEDDGSYTIPKGNLFPKGTEKTRPEIYTMGHRNAWRVSIDSKTGYMYWGEVGPDASVDSEIGPRGYDELNQARGPGNFGWPFFVGPNAPFPYYDFEKELALATKDPANYTNLSVNNTGLQLLPPVAAPFIYYPYRASAEFPLLGSGARSATGGPVFRRDDFGKDASRVFPAYYEGKWFVTDFSRGWIMAVTIDGDGNYAGMEPFLPFYQSVGAIDMKFGPEGDLYLIEYGSNWFSKSPNSKLVKIEYNGGNRTPIAEASADRTGGKLPFDVRLSAAGSRDLDGDKLTYAWTVTDEAGHIADTYDVADPTVRFETAGAYSAKLTVTDPSGASSSRSVKLIAGNATPQIEFALKGNATFFFPNDTLDYAVSLRDEEDGSLDAGITPDQVAVSIHYVSEGFDLAEAAQHQQSVRMTAGLNIAQSLMSKGNCSNCHHAQNRMVAPSLVEISKKYKDDPEAKNRLANKIRTGGNGVWGDVMMPANPDISLADSKTIVDYILGIANETANSLPVKGSFKAVVPEGDNGRGMYILQAGYTDRSVGEIPSHTVNSIVRLKNNLLRPSEATSLTGAPLSVMGIGGDMILKPSDGTVLGFEQIDLTDIRSLKLHADIIEREGNTGGIIELRSGSADGELLGTLDLPVFTAPKLPPLPTVEQTMQDSSVNRAQAEKMLAAIQMDNKRKTTPPEPILPIDTTAAGLHDLFLVFHNEPATVGQTLFTLRAIEFRAE